MVESVINKLLSLQKGLRVSKDLRVEQSYEDLEAAFQPGKDLSFDANVRLLDRQ